MRIIAGKHKGRRLRPPTKNPARPITDFAKEGLFNVLANYFDFSNISFLDLFAGTGAVSFEMASRGCTDLTLVEMYKPNVSFIERTCETLGINANVIAGDVFQFVPNCPRQFKIIFAGPPYALESLGKIPAFIFEYELLLPKGWLVLEHDKRNDFEAHEHFAESRKYGQAVFSIFTNE